MKVDNQMKQIRKFYEKSEDNKELTIYLYDDISAGDSFWGLDGTSKGIRDLLKDSYETVNVRINSYGGDVFEGIAIFNLLKSYPGKVNVYIDSCACSIASVIAMAGDKIYMPENTFMMIHNCWSYAMGNAEDLRKTAEDLDTIMKGSIASYMSRVNISEERLKELLDQETWLSAKDCVAMGFADELVSLKEDDSNYYQSCILKNVVSKINRNPIYEKIDLDELADKIVQRMKEEKEDVQQTNIQKENAFIKAFAEKLKKGE